jgi:hypothetical protein
MSSGSSRTSKIVSANTSNGISLTFLSSRAPGRGGIPAARLASTYCVADHEPPPQRTYLGQVVRELVSGQIRPSVHAHSLTRRVNDLDQIGVRRRDGFGARCYFQATVTRFYQDVARTNEAGNALSVSRHQHPGHFFHLLQGLALHFRVVVAFAHAEPDAMIGPGEGADHLLLALAETALQMRVHARFAQRGAVHRRAVSHVYAHGITFLGDGKCVPGWRAGEKTRVNMERLRNLSELPWKRLRC